MSARKDWGRTLGSSTMWRGARPRILQPVDTETVTLVLELQLDGDAIAGSASDSAGGRQTFVGWLGLVTAIDVLLSQRTATNLGRDE